MLTSNEYQQLKTALGYLSKRMYGVDGLVDLREVKDLLKKYVDDFQLVNPKKKDKDVYVVETLGVFLDRRNLDAVSREIEKIKEEVRENFKKKFSSAKKEFDDETGVGSSN